MEVDLFGNEILKDELLRDKFIEPPFTRLDAVSGSWQRRKNIWKNKGIKSEVGRQKELTGLNGFNNNPNYESRQISNIMTRKQREIFFEIYDYNKKNDTYILVNEKRLKEIPAELVD